MGTPTRENFPQQLITNTPPRPKRVLTTPALKHGLDEGRKAVMDDTGYAVPEVAIVYFQGALLPPLRCEFGDLSVVLANLANGNHLTTGGPWTLFNVAPADSEDTENKVFQSFQQLAEIVQEAAEPLLPQGIRATTAFRCNPNMQPISSQRRNTGMPDGYAVLTNPLIPRDGNKVHWADIVVPGEKKKKRQWDMINDNNRKLMWSMNHVMRDSARRRFVFGYTIENTSMRLWFCSRSDVIVSELFDFVKDHKILVHFFLSIIFATPSELGYDPTIVPARDDQSRKKGNYDVLVRSSDGSKSYFRTTKVLSNIGAEPLRGRGTRVWLVNKLNKKHEETSETFVLKDSWIDYDRTREGDILEQIRASATTDTQKEYLDTYFMTVECHGDVFINGELDNTHSLLRRGQDVPQDAKMWPLAQPRPESGKENDPIAPGFLPEIYAGTSSVILYDTKSHYRIIFREYGQTIDKTQQLSDIWFQLYHVLFALSILHECGWIHRDISAGNILIVNNLPKITDMEYAKRVDDKSPIHHGRTGTEHYIPIEVKTAKWQFAPVGARKKVQELPQTSRTQKSRFEAMKVRKKTEPRTTAPQDTTTVPDLGLEKALGPWKPNPLHDIESFWWLCVVLTICRAILDTPDLDHHRATLRKRFIKQIFSNFDVRRSVMTDLQTFREGVQWLPEPLQPSGLELESVRLELRDAYYIAEQDIDSIDHQVATALYPTLLDRFEAYVDKLEVNDVRVSDIGAEFIVIPSVPVPPAASLSLESRKDHVGKRLREEIDTGRIAFNPPQREPMAGPSAVADLEPYLKRVKLTNSLSLVLKAPTQSAPSDSEPKSESEPPQLPEASSSTNAKGKAPAVQKKIAARKKKAVTPNAAEPRRSQRKSIRK